MRGASDLLSRLLGAQNADGGWGYQGSTSWSEPTALAVLALQSNECETAAQLRGCKWLAGRQRNDGGWAPNDIADCSTSVTSVASLALSRTDFARAQQKSIGWILGQIKPELGLIAHLQLWLRQAPVAEATTGGSPWFPGTAAWIAPTAMSVLALSEACRQFARPDLLRELQRGQAYILTRRCNDGGWNHGGSQFLSESAESYPEMTGMALVALDWVADPSFARTLALAKKMANRPESGEAQSWLHIALAKHRIASSADLHLPCRTVRDVSLRLLALSTSSPANKLLSRAT